MHRLPADRAGAHVIDGHVVCDAAGAIGDPAEVAAAAARFSLLGDPTRLALLRALEAVGEMCVTDLAVATGAADPAVSQALRLLHAHGVVARQRNGRIVRYSLVDDTVRRLLTLPAPTPFS